MTGGGERSARQRLEAGAPTGAAGPVLASAARDALERQLRQVPAFRSLLRAVESTLLEAAGPFVEPLLDLGCGDGHFAAETRSLHGAVGLDPDAGSVAEARGRRGVYRLVVRGSALELPFATRTIATVVANSVLEHIPDLRGTLAEVGRVLRPGGRLLITSPSHRFPELLLGAAVLRAVGMRGAAVRYGTWFNRHSRHFHTLSAEEWRAALAPHGLRLVDSHYYFPPRSQRAFDALHYLGAPTLVTRRLLGRWIPWRNPLTLLAALRWLGPLTDPRPVPEGACVWCAARREA